MTLQNKQMGLTGSMDMIVTFDSTSDKMELDPVMDIELGAASSLLVNVSTVLLSSVLLFLLTVFS